MQSNTSIFQMYICNLHTSLSEHRPEHTAQVVQSSVLCETGPCPWPLGYSQQLLVKSAVLPIHLLPIPGQDCCLPGGYSAPTWWKHKTTGHYSHRKLIAYMRLQNDCSQTRLSASFLAKYQEFFWAQTAPFYFLGIFIIFFPWQEKLSCLKSVHYPLT